MSNNPSVLSERDRDLPPQAKRCRVIQTTEFEFLLDAVADRMIRHGRMAVRHRSSVGRNVTFHRQSGRYRYQVMVHDFVGVINGSSYTDMYIAGSHKHPEFFREVCRHCTGLPVSATVAASDRFPGLTMDWLNSAVQFIKHAVIANKSALDAESIRERLTPEQIAALPERFDAFLLPVHKTCLVISDTALLRRPCYTTTSNTVRWKYVFNCMEFPTAQETPEPSDSLADNYLAPQHARRHEMLTMGLVPSFEGARMLVEEPWPYRLPPHSTGWDASLHALIREGLDRNGVVCIPLANDHIARHTAQVAEYLGRLMHIPDPRKNLLDVQFVKRLKSEQDNPTVQQWLFRNPAQFLTRHIHDMTGRTLYGHYCGALKRMFTELEFLVRYAFGPNAHVWATTAEIFLQF